MRERILGTDPKEAIQRHQENADWEYRDEAEFWYGAVKEIYRRFYNGLIYPDGKVVPPPVIAFDDLRNQNTLACYDLFPDEYGLIGKITFNTQWYEKQDGKRIWLLGRYSQLETLDHETIHLNQQIGRGLDPYDQKKHGHETHNKEWHKIARGHGLNTEGVKGIHVDIATEGSPIDILARDLTISRPKVEDKPEGLKVNWADWLIFKGEKPKGRSTLHKYECPNCGLKVRVGVKEDPMLVHTKCGTLLVLADGKAHTLYKA